MNDSNKYLEEINKNLAQFGREYPEQMKSFHEFMHAVEKEGAISKKNKELILVALSVNSQCKWCIAFHIKNALESGAKKEEIMEAAWVATMMGGGPALMYMQQVIKALEDFEV